MATVSMLLLIVGIGGILLGLGWVLSDGVHPENIKPAWVGLLVVAAAMLIPLETSPSSTPRLPSTTQPVQPLTENLQLAIWPTVSTRLQFACATDQTGIPSCWGEPVSIGHQPVVGMAMGREHGCALAPTGVATCWGQAKPENDQLKHKRFMAIASTLETTCGITPSGALDCWGQSMEHPENDPEGFRFISGGAGHFCALNAVDEAVCWGNNESGQTASPPGTFASISAGHFHTCAIGSNSKVQCWGRNVEGQSKPPDNRFRQISSGWQHTCGIDQSGRLVCWGCGGNSDAVSLNTSSACVPPSGTFLAVSSGDLWKSCAVDGSGRPQCWGGLDYAGTPQ